MVLFHPQNLPVLALIVPFVLLFVALFGTWNLFLVIQRRIGGARRVPLRAKWFGAALCGGLVLLLVLQSLGQLSLRDVLTVVAITVIGYVYAVRNTSTGRER
jgi:NADH:ubiquinone oxidoreductase subunit 3 (subunit A)